MEIKKMKYTKDQQEVVEMTDKEYSIINGV